jgi:hypothetical protein
MLSKSLTLTLLASAGIVDAANIRRHIELHERATATSNSDTSLTLNANAVASGSFSDGLTGIGSEKFEAASATSQNNFMNFCAGETLTNGLQITTGSCNGIRKYISGIVRSALTCTIAMGQLPAKNKMMSSIITFPLAGSATIQSDTTFNITVQMSNIVAGSFTNADSTYFAAPQALQGGVVVGHTHVTVQDMGKSLNPTGALDPTQFAFFKGINDAGNGQGLLSATVTGGLPAGNYRVCTMASASNHQPAIMPVAQRGTADDCTKFTVVGSGTTANDASNNGKRSLSKTSRIHANRYRFERTSSRRSSSQRRSSRPRQHQPRIKRSSQCHKRLQIRQQRSPSIRKSRIEVLQQLCSHERSSPSDRKRRSQISEFCHHK